MNFSLKLFWDIFSDDTWYIVKLIWLEQKKNFAQKNRYFQTFSALVGESSKFDEFNESSTGGSGNNLSGGIGRRNFWNFFRVKKKNRQWLMRICARTDSEKVFKKQKSLAFCLWNRNEINFYEKALLFRKKNRKKTVICKHMHNVWCIENSMHWFNENRYKWTLLYACCSWFDINSLCMQFHWTDSIKTKQKTKP